MYVIKFFITTHLISWSLKYVYVLYINLYIMIFLVFLNMPEQHKIFSIVLSLLMENLTATMKIFLFIRLRYNFP